MNLGFKMALLRSCTSSYMRTLHTSYPLMCETRKMEKSLNQVTLLGRVGADPQKRGNEEHPVVNFSLATNNVIKYESGDVQRTDWHRICVFKPSLRDLVQNYIRKGQRVFVTGKISYGEIKTEDGQIKPATTIIADNVISFQQSQEIE